MSSELEKGQAPNPEQELARVVAARTSWVVLEEATDGRGAKRVQLLRPLSVQYEDFSRPFESSSERFLYLLGKYVVGWDGITLADIHGASQAPPDPVAYSKALAREVISDRPDWCTAVQAGWMDAIKQHQKRQADIAKN